MELFGFILILLTAVSLSNIVNRFIPFLSTPLIQIIFGVVITLIPFGAFGLEFELEPELFFVFFIAPLIFHEGTELDVKAMWQVKGPALAAAVLLVVLTVISGGYVATLLMPAMPLAIGFMLIAALGPTDCVSVATVAKTTPLPKKIMDILTGESVVNDATGITSFQFALLAAVTGAFSAVNASLRFSVMWVGGIMVGIVLSWVKHLLAKWLRTHGIENITLHILIGLLTPFAVYLVAEALSFSGILAALTSGIMHALMRDKFNPNLIHFDVTNKNVWSAMTFSLEGLVFVMLGTQLPVIVTAVEYGADGTSLPFLFLSIVGITLFLAATRFVWWIAALRKKTYQTEGEKPVGRVRAGLIFSLAGARGAISLATVMSIPLLFPDGGDFPHRDLTILMASGVIVLSMLLTNFVLPLLIDKSTIMSHNEATLAAYSEIIHKVTERLSEEATEENRVETAIVVKHYSQRIEATERHGVARKEFRKTEKAIITMLLVWQQENTIKLRDKEWISAATASYHLRRLGMLSRVKKNSLFSKVFILFLNRRRLIEPPDEGEYLLLLESNVEYVIEKLEQIRVDENTAVINEVITIYELILSVRRNLIKKDEYSISDNYDSIMEETLSRAFQIERELIQKMSDAGRISPDIAREMRLNLVELEYDLHMG